MKITPLKDADHTLVEIKDGYPHCKKHGAMNKLTKDGIWRCISTYAMIDIHDARKGFIENNCKAGFQECKCHG